MGIDDRFVPQYTGCEDCLLARVEGHMAVFLPGVLELLTSEPRGRTCLPIIHGGLLCHKLVYAEPALQTVSDKKDGKYRHPHHASCIRRPRPIQRTHDFPCIFLLFDATDRQERPWQKRHGRNPRGVVRTLLL